MMEIKYSSIKKKRPGSLSLFYQVYSSLWVSAKSSKTVIKKDIIAPEVSRQRIPPSFL